MLDAKGPRTCGMKIVAFTPSCQDGGASLATVDTAYKHSNQVGGVHFLVGTPCVCFLTKLNFS